MKVYIIAGVDETPIGGFIVIDKVFADKSLAEKRLEELKYDSINYEIQEREILNNGKRVR